MGKYTYDFGDNDLDTLDLFARALTDPSFDIIFDLAEVESKIDISIKLRARETIPNAEFIVYAVIIEKLINDPGYLVAGYDTAFENVVRDIVPNAAGISLIRSWNPGDTEDIQKLSWNISDNILDKEHVCVVVFVQNALSREIYQAASNDPELNGDPVIVSVWETMKARNLSMLVYPNPASSEVYMAFEEPLLSRVQIQMFTHTGSMVRNDLLPEGVEIHKMKLEGLSKGVYFIRAVQGGQVIGTQKLLIMQ